MTREEAVAYRRRYELVNAAEREELRHTPLAVKFAQLCPLMASVKAMAWDEDLARGEDEVRRRWQRLREACAGG